MQETSVKRTAWWAWGGAGALLLAGAAALVRTPAEDAAPPAAAGQPTAAQGPGFGAGLPGVAGTVPGAVAEPEAAFAAILREPPGEARADRLRAAFTRWLLAAPDDALAQRARIPAEDRRQVLTAALAALAQRQPGVFERHAGSLSAIGIDLADVIGALAEADAGRALDWVRRHPALDRDGRLSAAMLPALVHANPATAAGAVAALGNRAPPALIQQVAAAYARSDPAQAYAWVRQVSTGRTDVTPARLLDTVSGTLAAADADAAEQFMNRTPDADVRASLLGELAQRKGQDDLDAAWNWLGRYAGDARYADAAQNLLYRWSWTRPEAVAQLLPRVQDATVQADAAAHLTQMWRRKDPVAYEAWLASLPAGPLRTAALAAR
jgi:hypothetical protein